MAGVKEVGKDFANLPASIPKSSVMAVCVWLVGVVAVVCGESIPVTVGVLTTPMGLTGVVGIPITDGFSIVLKKSAMSVTSVGESTDARLSSFENTGPNLPASAGSVLEV